MMSFWVVPWSAPRVDAVVLGGDDVERQQPGRGRVDRHRRVHRVERDAVEQRVHVALVRDRARRPCRPRRARARGRGRSRSAWAGRRRSTGRSGRAPGSTGTARWTSPRWNGPRRCASSTGGRARAAGAPSADCMFREMSEHREIDVLHLGNPTGDLLPPARRRARRPRAGVQPRDAPGGARRPASARGPADPHPLRPRRRRRRAARALARLRGLGARARRPHLVDPSRLVASATRIYGDDMQRLWGEVVPVPEERLTVLERRRDASATGASRTRPATPRITSPTCTRPAASRSSATSAGVRIGGGPTIAARRRRPTSTSSCGTRRVDRVAGWGAERWAITHLRHLRRRRRAGSRPCTRASTAGARWPATPTPRPTSARSSREMHRGGRSGHRRGVPAGHAAVHPLSGPGALLGQEERVTSASWVDRSSSFRASATPAPAWAATGA